MGERKVLNKYFPPDFDPTKIPRLRRPKNHQIEVRMMLPFSIQCTKCAEFMYRGKKFNSKKEDVEGEDYKGIRKFRFYIKCVTCSQEITFKTDPQNADYELEIGATRNFEDWKKEDSAKVKHEEDRAAEDKGDAMKALENRTLDSKIEMDILDALDEIRAVNTRHERVDTAAILAKRSAAEAAADLDAALPGGAAASAAADELLVQSIKFKQKAAALVQHRLSDSDGSGDELQRQQQAGSSSSSSGSSSESKAAAAAGAAAAGGADIVALALSAAAAAASSESAAAAAAPLIVVKKKRKEEGAEKEKKASKKHKKSKKSSKDAPPDLGGLLGGYGSDTSD